MKSKNKILLGATSLLVASVAAMATSAYAWYTANRQAYVSYSNVVASSNSSSIGVELVTGGDFTHTTEAGAGETSAKPYVITTTAQKSGLVSGSGALADFVQPEIDYVDNTAYGFKKAAACSGSYFTFDLKFTISGEENLALYLSPSSKPTDATGSVNKLTGLRYSVCNAADGSLIAYCNPVGTATNDDYLAGSEVLSAAAKTPVANLAKKEAATKTNKDKIVDTSNLFGKAENYIESGLTTENYTNVTNGYLHSFTKAGQDETWKTTTLRFYVWLEGLYTDGTGTGFNAATDAFKFIGNYSFYILQTALIK